MNSIGLGVTGEFKVGVTSGKGQVYVVGRSE